MRRFSIGAHERACAGHEVQRTSFQTPAQLDAWIVSTSVWMRRPARKLNGSAPVAGDSVEKSRGLDRLQVVEAELMPRRYAEQSVGWMVRGGLNSPEPLTAAPIVGREEMQFVEALLAEG